MSSELSAVSTRSRTNRDVSEPWPLRVLQFRTLLWLFPVAVTLHNGEEAIWMPAWTAQHARLLPLHPPGEPLLWSALIVLTVGAFVVTYLSMRKGPESFWTYLTFGYIVAMLANVFVPHLPATLAFRSYTPGVVTACLINLPVMSILSMKAVRQRWVCGGKAIAFAVVVPLAAAAALAALFGLTPLR